MTKARRWRTVLISLACVLIVAGLAPLAYLTWWGHAHNFEPVSMPLPLKRGEYVSPFFATDLNDDYQVDIYWLPWDRTPLDLDWKIVDKAGRVIESGNFRDNQPGGNTVILGHYRPKRGLRQRVIINIHQDVQGQPDADVRLHVGLPERGVEQAYGFAAAIAWAAVIAGTGVVMLLVLLIQWAWPKPAAAVS